MKHLVFFFFSLLLISQRLHCGYYLGYYLRRMNVFDDLLFLQKKKQGMVQTHHDNHCPQPKRPEFLNRLQWHSDKLLKYMSSQPQYFEVEQTAKPKSQ
jgi:hypothetical protein